MIDRHLCLEEYALRIRNEESFLKKKQDIMVKCYDCYAENGLFGVGIKTVAKACGYTQANLYTYFEDLDDMILQSTEYCMAKVEDDFMARAPMSAEEVIPFLKETPYWTAQTHGAKYRLMYQVYSQPKYREHGMKFFEGVNKRYSDYAKLLEAKIGIPQELLLGYTFTFIRACVHYAMFEDEYYLQTQLKVLLPAVEELLHRTQTK